MLKLPLFNCGYPPVLQAGVPNLLSKCTQVGVSEIGSTYDHTPELFAEFQSLVLCACVNLCPTSNATPA